MAKVQGRFTADGNNRIVKVPSEIDSFRVYNVTEAGATNDRAFEFIWQRGMADGEGIYFAKSGGTNAVISNANANNGDRGFKLINSADQTIGNNVAVTNVTNAADFRVDTGDTAGLAEGDIVRLNSIATTDNTEGFDFEIDNIVDDTSFDIRWDLANSPGASGGAGFYRKVEFEPNYYPRGRYIVNITQASSAVVRTSVTHGYEVGQTVRLKVPSAFGMVQADDKVATITAVDTANNTFTLDLDSTAFTAFEWPTSAISRFATVNPSKFDTAEALDQGVDTYSDARENRAFRGMLLYAGDNSPAGNNNNVIYWQADTAELINNS